MTAYRERGVYWHRERTLLIADTHFGKGETFRSAGIAVPEGSMSDDLVRLDLLLSLSGAERLIVLGDFFHAAAGRSAEGGTIRQLSEWRLRHTSLEMILVRGNHDRHAGDPPAEWNIRVEPEALILPPFILCHDCETLGKKHRLDPALKPISGHIHPAVRLRDVTGASLQVPCFCFGRRGGLLPSFGSFTGNAVIRPQSGDLLFVVGPQELIELPCTRAA